MTTEDDLADLVDPEPDRVLQRGPGETGAIDVYDPAGVAAADAPLVVLVHGGFWRAEYDRRHLRALAAAIAATGRLVALPEYRRVGDEGGGWPGTRDDVVDLVRAVPVALGRRSEEAVLVGHSAGGHLAVLVAGIVPVRAAISLGGVLDLAAAYREGIGDGAAALLLAGDAAADPGAELIASADPMTLPLPDCGLAVIHGERDEEVPVAYSARFAARDPRIRATLLPDTGHYEPIDPRTPAFAVLLDALAPSATPGP